MPTPEPGPDEVLIRIRASTVSSGDVRARSLSVPRGFGLFARPVFGMTGPRRQILGTEFSGEVAARGANVTTFDEGDRIFGFPGINVGSHAEYRTMPANDRIRAMPSSFTFEEAAALSFGTMTALGYLHAGKVVAGERVMVIGASGAVGSAAVQIARHLGAEVTGVTSTTNIERVKAIGAHHVVDYTTTKYLSDDASFDVIYDTVGAVSYPMSRRTLTRHGRMLMSGASLPQLLGGMAGSIRSGHRVVAGPARERDEDMDVVRSLAESGALRPMIDRTYSLEQIREAHAYVDTGRKHGSVVVIISAT